MGKIAKIQSLQTIGRRAGEGEQTLHNENSESTEPTLLAPKAADAPLDDSTPVMSSVVVVVVDAEKSQASLDEDMVDYEPSPERLDVNVVYLSSNGNFIGDDARMDQFNFATQSIVFGKPKDSVNHLKLLHVKGHINGTPVHNMLVHSRAIVNLMTYLLYKKIGDTDEELIRNNMTISGVGGVSQFQQMVLH
jgi:hypothetical protein